MKNSTMRKFLVVLLTICLVLPAPGAALAGGKSGKKNFEKGVKHEASQQWDLAAQEYALAVNADPNNAEYRLRYYRALQNASIMFAGRGDELARQGDYASAYNAYRQAYNYDKSNELASVKMRNMLELQRAAATGEPTSNINLINGNYQPAKGELEIQSKVRGNKDVVQDISFKETEFKDVAKNVGRLLGLNVLFDESVRNGQKISVDLREVTMAKAFDLIMLQNKMTFEQVDRKTILIYMDNQPNRQKFEKAMIKPFYLGNMKPNDARAIVQSFFGGQRAAHVIEEQKILIVKATAAELQLIGDILESVDKNLSEVVIDVEIFEVSHDSMLQIGNQIATDKGIPLTETRYDKDGKPVDVTLGTSASLSNLGGIGRGAFALAGNTLTPFLGGMGTLFGLPPTTLSLLQQKGNSRLLNKLQVHALDGQSNTTKVGKSVPVSLGNQFGFGGGLPFGVGGIGGIGGVGGVGTGLPGQTGVGGAVGAVAGGLLGGGLGGFGGGFGGGIQYKDVGLVIEAKPKITSEGYIEVQMKIETTNVEAGADPLTPNFTQRSLNTTARILDGVTSIVASVNQDQKGDSRSGIPVLGMLPLVGRLFTTPTQKSQQSDIIITVTPHIIRSSEITKADNLARLAGSSTLQGGTGLSASIEDVIQRAQMEEELERRIIAQKNGLPAQPQTLPGQSPVLGTAPVNVNNASGGATIQDVRNEQNPPPQPRKISAVTNETLGIPSGGSSSSAFNQAPAPAVPETDPAVAQPNGAGAEGGERKEAPMPDLSENSAKIPEGTKIQQAVPVATPRPERLEKMVQEMRLREMKEREAQRAAARTQPQPAPQAPPPLERIVQPSRPVAPAVPTGGGLKPVVNKNNAAAATASNIEPAKATPGAPTVQLSLAPVQSRQQIGKSVTVNVQVDAQTALSSASIALKFDAAKLKLKSVRDGGLFGSEPDLMHNVEGGNLLVTLRPGRDKSAKAAGRLIVIEFIALDAGTTEIAFNGGETQIKLSGDLAANINTAPAQIFISRETVSSNDKK